MNINIQTANNTFLRSLSAGGNTGLKSSQQKMERQQKRDNQIAFWEDKKENLKNMKCGSLEEIERKLDLFHSYEDGIAAARTQYNNEQMFHVLDEAKERAEKLARKLEETRPKTPEERREDLAEKAFDSEGSDGILSEVLEDVARLAEQVSEETIKETMDVIEESMDRELEETETEDVDTVGVVTGQSADDLEKRQLEQSMIRKKRLYDGFDIRI